MALINRIARLFAADAHALVDKLEEPDLLLKQAQREMQRIVAQSNQRVGALTKRGEQLESLIAQVTVEVAECDKELDVCFKANDEDLARSVVRRRLQRESQIEQLQQQQRACEEDLAKCDMELRDRELALQELEQKVSVIESPSESPIIATGVTMQEVEIAFLAEKQARAGQ